MLMRYPAEHIQLPAPLEGALDLVHECLVNIARGENPELDLRNLRAVLLNLRELAEPNSNITEAVDEVFEAALAYQGEFAHAAKAGTDSGYLALLSAARTGTGQGRAAAVERKWCPSRAQLSRLAPRREP